MKTLRFITTCLLVSLAACLLSVGLAAAADISVDEDCSLENAIKSANGVVQVSPLDQCEAGDDDATDSDTITLDLSVTTDGVLALTTGYSISSDIIIEGQGATLEGDGTFRLFAVSNGASLTLQSLTLSKGNSSGDGGAIKVNGATLTLNNSVVKDSAADGSGGGIYANNSDVTLTNSAISNNALDENGSGDGGGMYFSGSGSKTLTIDRSGLDNNSAPGDGGGLFINAGSATISNSTFGENSAVGDGGGIYNNGDATVTHITASNNTAASGGGLYDASQLHLRNSILSDNTVDDCAGTLNTNVANLIKDQTCGHTELSADPGLIAMSGLPLYYALPAASGAVDKGSDAHCLPTDQRGIIRPADACDVGAAEYQPGAFSYQIQSAAARAAAEEGSSSGGGNQPDTPATPKPSTCDTPPEGVTISGYVQGTECQQRDSGAIGVPAIVEYGFLMAVDIWGYVPTPVHICFAQEGALILLDSSTSPRTIVPLATTIEDGMRCATVNGAGMVVLMPLDFITSGAIGDAETPLVGCQVTTDDYVNMRNAPDGPDVLYVIPNAISLSATARTAGWYKIVYAGSDGWISADYATAQGACQ